MICSILQFIWYKAPKTINTQTPNSRHSRPPPLSPSPTRVLGGGFTSARSQKCRCVPPLGVSQTHPLNSKPESPSAPIRTSYAVPGIKPFNPKKPREPFTISFLHSSLPMEIFAKTINCDILRGSRSHLMFQERKILYKLKTKSRMFRFIILGHVK